MSQAGRRQWFHAQATIFTKKTTLCPMGAWEQANRRGARKQVVDFGPITFLRIVIPDGVTWTLKNKRNATLLIDRVSKVSHWAH